MMTKEAPVESGRRLSSSVTAARPPAEAPRPTTGNDSGEAVETFRETSPFPFHASLPFSSRPDFFLLLPFAGVLIACLCESFSRYQCLWRDSREARRRNALTSEMSAPTFSGVRGFDTK